MVGSIPMMTIAVGLLNLSKAHFLECTLQTREENNYPKIIIRKGNF